jgi:hypothetical protein
MLTVNDKVAPVLKHHAMMKYGGAKVKLYPLLTLTLNGCEWSDSRLSFVIPERRSLDAHWRGGWVSPKAGLDAVARKISLSSACL